jgi:hypothetical protein
VTDRPLVRRFDFALRHLDAPLKLLARTASLGTMPRMADETMQSSVPLQFDTVETSTPTAGLSCAACQVPIGDTYFEINGKVACPNCQNQIASAVASGGGALPFVTAALFGAVAGAVGAVVWYFVREVTKLEIGLIAIVVGILVGNAVRRGSGNRGGLAYQVLAVVLTYLAIVSANVPAVWGGLRMGIASSVATEIASHLPQGEPAPAPDSDRVQAQVDEIVAHLPTSVWGSIGLVILESPFLEGVSNVIGWLIIFFGLQQAWRLTRATPVQLTGPYSLAQRGAAG